LKRLASLLFIVVLAVAAHHYYGAGPAGTPADRAPTGSASTQAQSGQVSGSGTVIRVLPDDDDGDRHQRFILRLASGQTLLVAHNIDLAPRVSDLHVGDRVEYRGEYIPNDKGGVVHWTHRDPAGRHPAGWLKHDGQTFQ